MPSVPRLHAVGRVQFGVLRLAVCSEHRGLKPLPPNTTSIPAFYNAKFAPHKKGNKDMGMDPLPNGLPVSSDNDNPTRVAWRYISVNHTLALVSPGGGRPDVFISREYLPHIKADKRQLGLDPIDKKQPLSLALCGTEKLGNDPNFTYVPIEDTIAKPRQYGAISRFGWPAVWSTFQNVGGTRAK